MRCSRLHPFVSCAQVLVEGNQPLIRLPLHLDARSYKLCKRSHRLGVCLHDGNQLRLVAAVVGCVLTFAIQKLDDSAHFVGVVCGRFHFTLA